MQRKTLLSISLGCLCVVMNAQTPLVRSDLGIASEVAPAYFGPNAFPVPDMPSIPGSAIVELAGDYFRGSLVDGASDNTCDLFARLSLPLFSERANLTLWMPVVEHYCFAESVARNRRIVDNVPLSGWEMGDIYIATDILLAKQRSLGADLVVRAAVKTALGGKFTSARYYDSAGYFFDATAYRTISFENFELRLGATLGFLCWQTDNARQNDALQYGASTEALAKHFNAMVFVGGYKGWEKDGDCPFCIKTQFEINVGAFAKPFVYLQQGLIDYPFSQIRIGIKYTIQ